MLTTGTMIKPKIIAIAPALIGEAMNLRNIFETVKRTPHAKLAHTESFVTPFQYNPYINGARKAPARAPHEIPMSCAIKVGGSRAITTLITMKNTSIILMQSNCFFSSISFMILSFIRSRVNVELDVSTKDDNVDIEADKTRTTTIPTKISGSVASMLGMIAS